VYTLFGGKASAVRLKMGYKYIKDGQILFNASIGIFFQWER
jgi:hypothetical protein